jgi:oligoendopeptidase F
LYLGHSVNVPVAAVEYGIPWRVSGISKSGVTEASGVASSHETAAKAKEEGAGFEEKYIALLQDTAVMTVEDLAMKHLNEDITKREFWEKGIALCIKDVEEFMELTAK